jgi:hypothetical protein
MRIFIDWQLQEANRSYQLKGLFFILKASSTLKIHAKDISNVHSSQFLRLLEYESLNHLWGVQKNSS